MDSTMKYAKLPDTMRMVYEERYREKGEGPVPEFYVGMDVGDEPDTTVMGLYSMEPKSGVVTVIETKVFRARR
jgi:hypothetical protein